MIDMLGTSLLNGNAGASLLRNRGRCRDLVARRITQNRRHRLRLLLEGADIFRQTGKAVDVSISLTSWRPRLNVLPLVLLGLLDQTVRPSHIDVWLTSEDRTALDTTLKKVFEKYGVRFKTCDDLGPHKKWLPLVESGATTAFAICDDDILYPPEWLERLLDEDRADAYVGVRCHRMRWTVDGTLRSYSEWEKEVNYTGMPARDLFITGCGGAIIYPERISKEFRDRKRIMESCPRADDIWLKAAHFAAGFPCYKTRFSFPCLEIPETKTSGLLINNVDQGQNDRQMSILCELTDGTV